MNRKYNEKKKLFSQCLTQTERLDPRYLENQEMRRKMVLVTLQRSYADRGQTYIWSMIIWIVSTLALSLFQRLTIASFLAAVITLTWTGVHNVRRP